VDQTLGTRGAHAEGGERPRNFFGVSSAGKEEGRETVSEGGGGGGGGQKSVKG